MRIVFFHAYPHQVAGAQRVTEELARRLAGRGHETCVLTPDEGPFPARLATLGIEVQVVRAPAPWRRYGRVLKGPRALPALATLPAYWAKLARELARRRPSLVHANDHRGVLLAGPAARAVGAPLVWQLHGTYPSRTLTALGGRLAARIVCVSEATRAGQPSLEAFQAKTSVVHNGLLTVPAEALTRPRREPTSPVIVTGARIHPDKGLDILLRATAELRSRFPSLRVLVAGEPQLGYERHYEELLALRRALALEKQVSFLGRVPDPLALWEQGLVYCQPSRREPFGLAVLEAMALALPIVASSVDGLTEVVAPGVNGVLIAPDDPVLLAEELALLLDDQERRRVLGEAGRALARERFSAGPMLEQLLSVYREAARGASVRAPLAKEAA